jgi:hypothetical protein
MPWSNQYFRPGPVSLSDQFPVLEAHQADEERLLDRATQKVFFIPSPLKGERVGLRVNKKNLWEQVRKARQEGLRKLLSIDLFINERIVQLFNLPPTRTLKQLPEEDYLKKTLHILQSRY